MTVFTSPRKIRFSQSDAAQIVFFGNVYAMAHDAYEDFVQHLGYTWAEWFDNKTWAVPIRSSSCDYFRPLRPGQDCSIEIRIDKIGETSLGLNYRFMIDGHNCCEVRLTHSFVARTLVDGRLSKTAIPSDVRSRLETYRLQSADTK